MDSEQIRAMILTGRILIVVGMVMLFIGIMLIAVEALAWGWASVMLGLLFAIVVRYQERKHGG